MSVLSGTKTDHFCGLIVGDVALHFLAAFAFTRPWLAVL